MRLAILHDLNIPGSIKQPLLRNFHLNTVGSSPDKGHQQLVEYERVLSPSYKISSLIYAIAWKTAWLISHIEPHRKEAALRF